MSNNSYSGWGPEQKAHFKKLFEDGVSYGDTARELNGKYGWQLTRSAISGIVSRNGLSRRTISRGAPKQKRRQSYKTIISPTTTLRIESMAERKAQTAALGIEEASPEERAGIRMLNLPIWKAEECDTRPLLSLDEDACRWPFDLPNGMTGFCINARGHGPYCLAHGALAYRANDPERASRSLKDKRGPNVNFGNHNV